VGAQNVQPNLLLAGILTHPSIGRAVSVVFRNQIPVDGIRFDTSVAAVDDRSKASLFWGFYEKAERGFIKSLLLPDFDAVELGGSLGVVTSTIARRLERGRRVVTVEANPRMIPALRENVDRHRGATPVTIVHGAISYDGRGDTVAIDIGDRSVAGRVAGDGAAGSTVAVPRLTLAGLLEEHRIGEFTLVCDIEGAEIGLFLEDAPSLERCRQIVIELHEGTHSGRGFSLAEAERLVLSLPGFRLIARHGPVLVLERS
jgi:FkbM family methyltransferase